MPSAAIQERGTVSGNQMRMSRPIEDATQSFVPGTPVAINPANGAILAWTGTVVTTGGFIAGIAKEFGANLASAGIPAGYKAPLPPGIPLGVIPPYVGGGPTYPAAGGGVQNMPNALNLLRPVFNDGRTGIILAITDTLFYGQVGPSSPTPTAPSQLDVGKIYGLTKEALTTAVPPGDGVHWYIDRAKNTTATGCIEIVGLDQWDTARGLLFTFLPNVGQLLA